MLSSRPRRYLAPPSLSLKMGVRSFGDVFDVDPKKLKFRF